MVNKNEFPLTWNQLELPLTGIQFPVNMESQKRINPIIMDVHNYMLAIMDIHNSIMDIHNRIMDIHN